MAEKQVRTVVGQGPNWKRYSDDTLLIMNVRCSYPHLAEPQKSDLPGVPDQYSLDGMMWKTSHRAAKDALKKRNDELIAENPGFFKKGSKPIPDKKYLKDGDTMKQEQYAGHYIFSAKENRRPSIRDKDKSHIDREDIAEKIFGGVIVNVLVRPWISKNKDPKVGVVLGANLVAVQLVKDDGTRYGLGRIGEDEIDDTFDEIDDDADGGFADDDDDGL